MSTSTPTFDLFLTEYQEPIVYIFGAMVLLVFLYLLWQFYKEFQNWYNRL